MSKITKEQLEKLSKQQENKQVLERQIGLLEYSKHRALTELAQVHEEQNKFMVELEDIYGKITINLEDGSYEKIEEGQ